MRILLVVLFLLFSFSLLAQSAEDRKSIEKAILNYVDAFYEADTTKAYESIAQDLAKRGYYKKGSQVVEVKMSFEQLVQLAQ